MNAYRLLRNNTETGPYNTEQLIAMGLKAYDLVWVDGKSAAWRYPSELPELQAFAPAVEEQPFDRFFRRDKKVDKAAKPRFRVKADWRKIDDNITDSRTALSTVPAEKAPVLPENVKSAGNSDPFRDNTIRWQHPSSVSERKPDDKEKAALQTKYSESLDDIKEKYAKTILRQRSFGFKSGFARYALLIGLFPAMAAGIWIGSSWNNQQKLETVNTAATSAPAPEVIPAAPAQQPVEPAMQEATEQQAAPPSSEEVDDKKLYIQASAKPVTKAAAGIKNVPATVAAHLAKNAKPGIVTGKQPNIAAASVNTIPVTQTVYKTSVAPAKKAEVLQPVTSSTGAQAYESVPPPVAKNKIMDYVSVNDEFEEVDENNRKILLHVHNKSSIPVDLVVLDLQYYDSNGKFKKGETLYVNNLSANDEVALQAPAAKNNLRVNYKVSLLSIEKKGVYLIAE